MAAPLLRGVGRSALLRLARATARAVPGGALWYQSPGAAPPHFMGALMSGMVILMIPAFLICVGITVYAYRRRKQGAETEAEGESAPSFDVATDADDEPWR